jgi:dCMP deaminase
MEIATVVAKRSTCVRHHVGAIIVKDNQILSTGYNGAPSGFTDCLELGCLREQQGIPSGKNHEICRAVHAEQNAIVQAALHGVSTEGATLYCTHQPCILCTKMIINAKIKRVVFQNSYPDQTAIDFMKAAGLIE